MQCNAMQTGKLQEVGLLPGQVFEGQHPCSCQLSEQQHLQSAAIILNRERPRLLLGSAAAILLLTRGSIQDTCSLLPRLPHSMVVRNWENILVLSICRCSSTVVWFCCPCCSAAAYTACARSHSCVSCSVGPRWLQKLSCQVMTFSSHAFSSSDEVYTVLTVHAGSTLGASAAALNGCLNLHDGAQHP